MKRIIGLSAVVAVFLLAVSPSFGAVVLDTPAVSISWLDAAGAVSTQTLFIGTDSELFSGTEKEGSIYLGGADALKKYGLDASGLTYFTMEYNKDPYVTGGFSFTNGTNITQTYVVIFQAPVAPAIVPSSLYGGSMSASFTADPTAATVTTVPNTALYQGKIDGTTVLTFFNPNMSWTTPAYSSATIGPANQLPPALVGPAVMNNIAIQFTFTLTPGDTATMNGAFVVIPEPATLALLGLGGLLVFRRK
jgi:hypothetical protein